MKHTERPILFSADMVRAILDGRKTQTRRVFSNWPTIANFAQAKPSGLFEVGRVNPTGRGVFSCGEYRCPYGRPGDVLYVREAFTAWSNESDLLGWRWWHEIPRILRVADAVSEVAFRADASRYWVKDNGNLDRDGIIEQPPPKWMPGIFMPKWMSRIRLRITSIRVERVQEITPLDAMREGVSITECPDNTGAMAEMYVPAFRDLWNTINAKRGYGWDKNPWVWVVSFERIK